jgi:hypothetical protein
MDGCNCEEKSYAVELRFSALSRMALLAKGVPISDQQLSIVNFKFRANQLSSSLSVHIASIEAFKPCYKYSTIPRLELISVEFSAKPRGVICTHIHSFPLPRWPAPDSNTAIWAASPHIDKPSSEISSHPSSCTSQYRQLSPKQRKRNGWPKSSSLWGRRIQKLAREEP